jgi:hypothetical protein
MADSDRMFPDANTELCGRLKANIVKGEGQDLEFTRELPENVTELAKEIAGLATSNAATIYVGVENDGRTAETDRRQVPDHADSEDWRHQTNRELGSARIAHNNWPNRLNSAGPRSNTAIASTFASRCNRPANRRQWRSLSVYQVLAGRADFARASKWIARASYRICTLRDEQDM